MSNALWFGVIWKGRIIGSFVLNKTVTCDILQDVTGTNALSIYTTTQTGFSKKVHLGITQWLQISLIHSFHHTGLKDS